MMALLVVLTGVDGTARQMFLAGRFGGVGRGVVGAVALWWCYSALASVMAFWAAFSSTVVFLAKNAAVKAR